MLFTFSGIFFFSYILSPSLVIMSTQTREAQVVLIRLPVLLLCSLFFFLDIDMLSACL